LAGSPYGTLPSRTNSYSWPSGSTKWDATRPTKRVVAPPEDVAGYFGYLSWAASLDNPTSSALTQKLLGRHPTHPGLVEDLDEGHYFQI
jgi:hypothetical protein